MQPRAGAACSPAPAGLLCLRAGPARGPGVGRRQDSRLLASGAVNALPTEGRTPGLGAQWVGQPAWARGGSQRRGRAREARKPGVLRDTDTAAPREGPCPPLAEFGLHTDGEKMKTF